MQPPRMLEELWDEHHSGHIDLNEWEQGFVLDLMDRVPKMEKLTDKQFSKLLEIYNDHIASDS